ncbi:MAG: hypothetical protein AAF355_15240 [Myxococcota bacterium]
MTKFRILVGVVLSMLPFSTATDCGVYQFRCIDFSGLEIDFQHYVSSSCPSRGADNVVKVPEHFGVSVLDEPWFPDAECDIHRAELVSEWEGIIIGEPTDRLVQLTNVDRFVAAHEVMLEEIGCSGVLVTQFQTAPISGVRARAKAWLELEDDRPWLVQVSFTPDPTEECSHVALKNDSYTCGLDAAEAE